MTGELLISIVIPTYQHAATLPMCLDALFSQTYKNIQVIVVNDGSTDGTDSVVQPYLDRIVYIVQENAGSNPARNRGWEEATGAYIIFCDADVRMKPDMLQKLVDALEKNPEASYAYSASKFGWKTFGAVAFSDERLRTRNFIHTSALIRADDFPGFDNAIKRLQDWDVWLTMLASGKRGVLVTELLFEVEVDGDSRIGSSWMPSFVYKVPWGMIGWAPPQVRKYEDARRIIMKKHGLNSSPF